MGQPVVRIQILAKGPDQAARFYHSVFGWKVDENNALGYRSLDTGSERGINAGIWPSPPDGHSFVQLYIEVEDVGASVDQAVGMGGRQIIAPLKLPDGDEMAVIADPEGIPVGLFKPRSQ
ncbi:MAG TPA: VOC family protein [Blastocatellia bacterium]